MSFPSTGILSATQLNTMLDALATVLKNSYSNLGLGSPGESATTFANLTKTAAGVILGDGSTTYGLGNASFQALIKDPIYGFAANARYDSIFSSRCRSIVTQLESWIVSNVPSGLTYTSSTQKHALDAYLLRLNGGMNSSAPTTPASAGVLTAANNSGGGIPNCTSGNCPYVRHTLISTSGDWYESLPSAEATRVAISGPQNSLEYLVGGTVPTGVTKMAVFRGYVGGSSGTEYFDQLVTGLDPGSAYPTVIIRNPDTMLNTFWQVPVWGQSTQSSETAAIFALAFAIANLSPGQSINPLQFSPSGMLSPNNVFANPSNQFLGIGNVPSNTIFASRVVGTGFTAGSLNTVNAYAQNVQGFCGAVGTDCLSARVTAVLDSAGSATPNISWYDSVHGWGNVQTTTLSAAAFSGTGVGSIANFTIGADANGNPKVVIGVNSDSTSGITSGTYIYEPRSGKPRSY